MKFEHLPIEGLVRVVPDRHEDSRGYFARTFCREAFAEQGLADCSFQCSVSHNIKRATLRGMHFQKAPHGEAKLVRCTQGAIFDVAVDIRPSSPTFGSWHGDVLDTDNGNALFIPRGFAHGFMTLTDAADVLYQIADPFVPNAASGLNWNDSDIGIRWPLKPVVISERDQSWPGLNQAEYEQVS
jgi:dTDP-4-dehydrorhamnose 3,5-epimerase